MPRLCITFDDAQLLAFMQSKADGRTPPPVMVGSTVLQLPGGADWALSPDAGSFTLEKIRSDIAGVFPEANLIGLDEGIGRKIGKLFDFEYLAVAVQALIGRLGNQTAALPVDVALPTIAALFHPYNKWNAAGGKAERVKERPGSEFNGAVPLRVFDGSNTRVKQSLEIACVGAGVPMVRTEWAHVLIKEHIARSLRDRVDLELNREINNKLQTQIHAIMIVELHLKGIVLTPLWKFKAKELSFNRHSVFVPFDFVAWISDILTHCRSVSLFDEVSEEEKPAYLQSVLFGLPSAVAGQAQERSLKEAGVEFDPAPLVAEIDRQRDVLASRLSSELLTGVFGRDPLRTGNGRPDEESFNNFLKFFEAFAAEDGTEPDNRHFIEIRGYLPTGLLAAHKAFGPIIIDALRNLLWDPKLREAPARIPFCEPLGQVARLFNAPPPIVGTIGGRFWDNVHLNEKPIEPRQPRRELVTVTFPRPGAAGQAPESMGKSLPAKRLQSFGEFSLTLKPKESAETSATIDFKLPDHHVGAAAEVEVRMESLERVLVRLFLNGAPYYDGSVKSPGSLIINDRGKGEFDIFANGEHELVCGTAERIRSTEQGQSWRLLGK